MNNLSLFYYSKDTADSKEIGLSYFKFPGGEIQVKISVDDLDEVLEQDNLDSLQFMAELKSSDDIMTLLLAKDALDRLLVDTYAPPVYANIKYFPYARQDRVASEGEALSIKVMANLINSCNFDVVKILDPHSEVTPALINNCQIMPQESGMFVTLVASLIDNTYPRDIANYVFVSPDAGATKKTFGVAKIFSSPYVLQASKQRDVKTGKITGTVLGDYSHIPDITPKKFFVVDDICDGGRTFIELAKLLDSTFDSPEKYLYVSHGIFSHPEGPDVLKPYYEKVFVYNNMFAKNHSSKYPILSAYVEPSLD